MAKLDAILIPGQGSQTRAQVNATTSTAEIEMGRDTILSVVGTKAFTIAFGKTGMAAASATNGWYVPANQSFTFDMGKAHTHFRLFNTDGSAGDFYYGRLVAA
jgi:hypothetical protein